MIQKFIIKKSTTYICATGGKGVCSQHAAYCHSSVHLTTHNQRGKFCILWESCTHGVRDVPGGHWIYEQAGL